MSELSVYEKDPTIYLFTSLTAGSSHIITATSRIETILKANKIPFKGVDTATDDLARKLFQRRASGKKLPLIVKEGYVLGGIEEIEEWNEYDELREALGVTSAFTPMPAKPTSLFEPTPSKTPPPLDGTLPGGFSSTTIQEKENTPILTPEQNLAIRLLGAEAAKAAAAKKPIPVKISTTNPLMTEKAQQSIGSIAGLVSPRSSMLPQSPTQAAAISQSIGDILSPRSIPLPKSPAFAISSANAEASGIPKLEQKPVHAPLSMHIDAENPILSAGPISSTQKAETSDTGKTAETKIADKRADDKEMGSNKTDVKKADTKKLETKKVDTKKTDAKKAEPKKTEVTKAEVKTDGKKSDAKKVDLKKVDTKKAVEKKVETRRFGTRKTETKKVDPKQAGVKKVGVKKAAEVGDKKVGQKALASERSVEETGGEEEEEKTTSTAAPEENLEEVSSEEEEEEDDDDDVVETQKQDSRDASKAGVSVKE